MTEVDVASHPDDEYEIPEFDTESEDFEQHPEEPEQEVAHDFEEPQAHLLDEPEPAEPHRELPSRQDNLVDKKIVNLTGDIPIQIVAVLGKKTVSVKEIVSLRMGQVVELGRLPNEAIDLVANGKLIAKGEVVEIDGRLGVRILKMFD